MFRSSLFQIVESIGELAARLKVTGIERQDSCSALIKVIKLSRFSLDGKKIVFVVDRFYRINRIYLYHMPIGAIIELC